MSRFMSAVTGAVLGLGFASVSATAQFGQGANVAGDPSGVLRLGPLTRVAAETAEIVSSYPERFPKELLPADATFTAASTALSMMVVVVAVPKPAAGEPWRYAWALEDRGWLNFTMSRFGITALSPSSGGPTSGSTGFANTGAPLQFCKGPDFADISFWQHPDGRSYVRLAVGPDTRRTCGPKPFSYFNDLPLPLSALTVPLGIGVTSAGASASRDHTEVGARLDLSRAPAVTTPTIIAEHFARQLSAGGWKLEAPAAGSDPTMATVRMSTRSKTGDPVTAIVIVTALADTPFVDAIVRVVRHKPGG